MGKPDALDLPIPDFELPSLLKRGISWLSVPGVARDAIGVYNEYAVGKKIRQNMGSIEVLIPSLTSALGASQASSLVSTFALPVGVGVLALQVWQGAKAAEMLGRVGDVLDAQTGLMAAEKFAQQVWDFVSQRVHETAKVPGERHFFFVYHPDTNWYPALYKLQRKEGQIDRYMGMSEQLDLLCHWMKHVRQFMGRYSGRKRVVLHLLMPAYRRIYIRDKLTFPEELCPLEIEGHIYNSAPFVTLNVTNKEDGQFVLSRVGNEAPKDSNLWNLWGMWTPGGRPRMLGQETPDPEAEKEEEIRAAANEVSQSEAGGSTATEETDDTSSTVAASTVAPSESSRSTSSRSSKRSHGSSSRSSSRRPGAKPEKPGDSTKEWRQLSGVGKSRRQRGFWNP
ncbi:uncharacterized protein BDR25DRAFT_262551 [Lindgomyces ingoldianus]|uniref:Uncharacterized protein n=1 Tax=Lindgomyces ingoldianus TaxID=673940 RepID=A0ACB6QV96_9PLEO|nr:uncharacterized protein BDR25DRAFT_262551 [Lindgomyces ingoldianus]KAF2470000.1 hypothetical protein BDR25DRAFT_262551 [Lindgomyces ingoldianus]